MDALHALHDAGVLHRGVSPANIHIRRDGKVKLLAADGVVQLPLSDARPDLDVIIYSGYSPFEQYTRQGTLGPWTDVYALAATLYRTLTGTTPPEAPERLEEDRLVPPAALGIALPATAERALMRALALRVAERTPDIGIFRNELQSP